MTLLLPFSSIARVPPKVRRLLVMNLVNAYPILRSSSIRAATASACLSSRSIGFLAARITWLELLGNAMCWGGIVTYALSILLNLALLMSKFGFPFKASVRTSVPICSPSRSQSVQMNRALAQRAWLLMLSAMASLLYHWNK